VNAKVRQNGFSVRSSVKSSDVPLNFKPTHNHAAVHNDLANEVQAILDNQKASPRRKYYWPETAQHVVGWLVEDDTSTSTCERAIVMGVPPRHGIGWPASTGNAQEALPKLVATKVQAAQHAAVETAHRTTPRQRRSHDAVPGPFAGSSFSPRPVSRDLWDADSGDALRTPSQRQVQEGIAVATRRSRNFLNQVGNRWYRPKGTCDVVQFGDAYVRSFGKSLFGGSSTEA